MEESENKSKMNEKEVFFNGFCRCQNQGRIVLCVYIKEGEK